MTGSDRVGQVDVVIVGSGAGGGPLAHSLAKAGLSVVVLEAGAEFAPSDHIADELETNLYWMEERLSGGGDPTAFGPNNSGFGVGGSTLHWGAFCPRPDPRDLLLKSSTGEGEDWPICHAELVSYIVQVEAMIGVSGAAYYPWDAGRKYRYSPPKRNAPAQAMARGCEKLDITTADAPAALVTQAVEQPFMGTRGSCANCGACHQGCFNASKAGSQSSWLPSASAHGARILANTRLIDVELDSRGRVSGVIYISQGKEVRQACNALFLCAGGIETPRILLNLGIANSSGQVGRNFMAHIATQVWGRFDDQMRMNRGYPSSLITEDFLRPRQADFAGGYLIQSLGVQPVTLANSLARGAGMWGENLVSKMRDYNHLAGIGINGDCLPSTRNMLALSDELDAYGMRKASIDFTMGENEKSLDAHATRTLRGIWEAAGARDVFAVARSAHTLGTCRMGHDRDYAVVDPDGRSFDIENLYICDNSTFPSALAANPALTQMALGLRTADRFLAA